MFHENQFHNVVFPPNFIKQENKGKNYPSHAKIQPDFRGKNVTRQSV